MSTTTDIFTARQMEIIEGCLNDAFKKLTMMLAGTESRKFATTIATKIVELNEVIAIVEGVTQAEEPPVVEMPEPDIKDEPMKIPEEKICKFCAHCTGHTGHARAIKYTCGLSGAEFGPKLGCDAFVKKEEEQP